MLDDRVSNQPSKFKTKNWVEINGESRGGYTIGSVIKFKTAMLRSSLCDYPAGKYWSSERLEDVPLQRPQDVP